MERTPASSDISPRARALIEQNDPRVVAVDRRLAPELPPSFSPDQRHYAAAVAVAALDIEGERGLPSGSAAGGRRPRQPRAPRRRRDPAMERVGLVVTIVLFALVLGVLGAGVVWLWTLVL
ncbi:hypothetical protein [Streptomyces sp. SM14]|uniref:hypothetical protein n=1 Tax=Streptomyces sp. SM14 TaxID=1736045 RepID=UPI000CD58ED9|nr:hypothetical protein [Streptomyces sp. SM14]